jgi:hypothetical protein
MTAITTLIPAFKPDYLGEALLGLRRQSVRDFRVIVSDDSPGGAITDMIRDRRFGAVTDGLDLTVVRGPGNARLNHLQLLDLWNGATPYVHLLMDDDVVFPGFYRTHLQALASGPHALSASARWLSQDDSRPAWSLPLPRVVEDSPQRFVALDAAQLFPTIVPVCENWIGELSNIVLTADAAARYPRPPAERLNYYGLLDIGAVLEAVGAGSMVFVRDHLSVFRQHAQQTTRGIGSHGHRVAMLVWATYALHAWQQQRIDARDAVQAISITVKRCLEAYGEDDPVMNQFFEIVQREGRSLAGLHLAYSRFWLALLASHPGTAPKVAPAVTVADAAGAALA